MRVPCALFPVYRVFKRRMYDWAIVEDRLLRVVNMRSGQWFFKRVLNSAYVGNRIFHTNRKLVNRVLLYKRLMRCDCNRGNDDKKVTGGKTRPLFRMLLRSAFWYARGIIRQKRCVLDTFDKRRVGFACVKTRRFRENTFYGK